MFSLQALVGPNSRAQNNDSSGCIRGLLWGWCGGGDLQNEDPNTCVQFRGQPFSEAAFFGAV